MALFFISVIGRYLLYILYFEVDFYGCDIEFQYHGRGYSELTEYFLKKIKKISSTKKYFF